MSKYASKYKQQISQAVNVQTTDLELGLMMAHLIRVPQLRSMFINEVKTDHFDYNLEKTYWLVWLCVQQAHQAGEPINFTSLLARIDRATQDDPAVLYQEDLEALVYPNGILYAFFAHEDKELTVEKGIKLVRQFLYEREVVGPLREHLLLGADQGAYTPELPDCLKRSITQLQRIAGMGSAQITDAMPAVDEYSPEPEIRRPTGLSFIDNAIGGVRPQDVIGIIGPTGSGKSTLLRHIGVTGAKLSWEEARRTGGKPGIVVCFSYEEPNKLVMPALWANAAKIKRSRLVDIGMKLSLLSTRSNLQPYDTDVQAASARSDGVVLGELERYEAARAWFNQTFKLVDMSGNDRPGVGTGGVDEMVGMMDHLMATFGHPPVWYILIDYCLLCVVRYMDARGINVDQKRHYVGSFGDQVRRQLAMPYNCPVFVAHQAAGATNARTSASKVGHGDAAESKSFAENMALCGALGTMDPISSCAQFNWTKVRYNGRERAHSTLHVNGDFCTMDDVSNDYTIDPTTGGIVSINEIRRIQGAAAARRSASGHSSYDSMSGV